MSSLRGLGSARTNQLDSAQCIALQDASFSHCETGTQTSATATFVAPASPTSQRRDRGSNHDAGKTCKQGRPSSHFGSREANMRCQGGGQSSGRKQRAPHRRQSWLHWVAFCLAVTYSTQVGVCSVPGGRDVAVMGVSVVSTLSISLRVSSPPSETGTQTSATATSVAPASPTSQRRDRGSNHDAAARLLGT